MYTDDYLRPLINLDHEQRQHSICLVAASAVQDSPKLFSVYCVIGLLEVNQSRITPPLLPLPRVDLSEESGRVRSSRGALLEASLVDLGL